MPPSNETSRSSVSQTAANARLTRGRSRTAHCAALWPNEKPCTMPFAGFGSQSRASSQVCAEAAAGRRTCRPREGNGGQGGGGVQSVAHETAWRRSGGGAAKQRGDQTCETTPHARQGNRRARDRAAREEADRPWRTAAKMPRVVCQRPRGRSGRRACRAPPRGSPTASSARTRRSPPRPRRSRRRRRRRRRSHAPRGTRRAPRGRTVCPRRSAAACTRSSRRQPHPSCTTDESPGPSSRCQPRSSALSL